MLGDRPVDVGLVFFAERVFHGLLDRWRDGTVVPARLMLEHKTFQIKSKYWQRQKL